MKVLLTFYGEEKPGRDSRLRRSRDVHGLGRVRGRGREPGC